MTANEWISSLHSSCQTTTWSLFWETGRLQGYNLKPNHTVSVYITWHQMHSKTYAHSKTQTHTASACLQRLRYSAFLKHHNHSFRAETKGRSGLFLGNKKTTFTQHVIKDITEEKKWFVGQTEIWRGCCNQSLESSAFIKSFFFFPLTPNQK